MTQLLYIVLYPLLFFVSIPLVALAFFTTFAASSTLLFRVLLVYADLAAVLIKNQFLHPQSSKSPLSPLSPRPELSGQCGRTRSSSGDSHVSRTPRSVESSGLGIYSAGSMQRDFEGVGGWRFPNTESEDILWTSMNARLELPALAEGRNRHHRRSITSSGTPPPSSRFGLSEHYEGRAPTSARSLGTTSPEEYFVARHSSGSTTALATVNLSNLIQ